MISKSDLRIIAALAAHPDADAVYRAYAYGRLCGRNEAIEAGLQAARALPSVFDGLHAEAPRLHSIDDDLVGEALTKLQRGNIKW